MRKIAKNMEVSIMIRETSEFALERARAWY